MKADPRVGFQSLRRDVMANIRDFLKVITFQQAEFACVFHRALTPFSEDASEVACFSTIAGF